MESDQKCVGWLSEHVSQLVESCSSSQVRIHIKKSRNSMKIKPKNKKNIQKQQNKCLQSLFHDMENMAIKDVQPPLPPRHDYENIYNGPPAMTIQPYEHNAHALSMANITHIPWHRTWTMPNTFHGIEDITHIHGIARHNPHPWHSKT